MWKISTLGSVFSTPIRLHASRITLRMEACPPEHEVASLCAEWEELKQFRKSLCDLLDAHDPTPFLAPAVDESGDPIPDYYVHTVGKWEAYFRVDYIGQAALGKLIRYKDDDVLVSLSTILDVIK